MMSKTLKESLKQLLIPIIYAGISITCIFTIGRPLISMGIDQVYAVLKQNQPMDVATYQSKGIAYLNENFLSEEEVPLEGSNYAVLLCERIGIKADVYYGDSEKELTKGIGQYVNGGFPWNQKRMLLGGHDITYFEALEEIKVKDEIIIKTHKKDYRYVVEEIQIVDKESITVDMLQILDQRLILYTCYPFGEVWTDRDKRYIVYCKAIHE